MAFFLFGSRRTGLYPDGETIISNKITTGFHFQSNIQKIEVFFALHFKWMSVE